MFITSYKVLLLMTIIQGGGGGRGHRTFCGSVYHMIPDGSVKDSETVQIKAIDHSVARRL